MTSNRSDRLFQAACEVIPGGVNSPVRAFRGVGGNPVFFARAQGAYLFDADDRCYIDYVCSWGPAILGHAHPEVIREVQEAATLGLSFGAPTEVEVEMATRVRELMPSMELVRMVSSGTEATMSAIRLARGYTKRDVLVKFEGCYHGHSDSLLVKAGSGALTLGVPSSAGVPESLAVHTITLPYNDLAATQAFFAERGHEVACVIVEPVAGNMNLIPPVPGFLQGLREVCDSSGAVLIFDEVMTGFRVALGGAQALYGVKPDLTTLGKIIGGGMPVGAFGGRRDIMECIAPLGPVYQAGTLSGNPIAMRAGLMTLKLISQPLHAPYVLRGMNPATDAVFRMRPLPRPNIPPRAACVSRMGTSMCRRRWSTSSSIALVSKSSGSPNPALFTSTSIGCSGSASRVSTRARCRGFNRSATSTSQTTPCRALIARASSRSASRSRATSTRLAPIAANCHANSAPSPELAPVISAALAMIVRARRARCH